jgi:AcrR family transcriptional regulator
MPTDPTTSAPAGPSRSARKHAAILEAAQSVFLAKGYAGATMDEVAALAAVSKQTVYKHFADKKQLFTAVITGEISATETRTLETVAALAESDDLANDLRRFARQHVVDVTQPHLIRLRRIVIAEAEAFPELARAWYANGPERGHATLAEQFGALARRGLLRFDDALLAAQHFNWLILAIPLNEAMFDGGETTFAHEALEDYADQGVRVFLAAYAAT